MTIDNTIKLYILEMLPLYEKRLVGCTGYLYRDIMTEVYSLYQGSQIWKNVVSEVKKRDQNLCRNCGIELLKNAVVHHCSYNNWGKGDILEIDDCILVCRKCHANEHKKLNNEYVPFFAHRESNETRIEIKMENMKKLMLNEIG